MGGGAKGWYRFGKLNMQPLEFMKIALVIYMAVYYNRIASDRKATFFQIVWPMVLAAITAVLVAMQPDFGGAFIIGFIALLIFFSIPLGKKQKKYIIKYGGYALLIVIVAILLFGKSLLHTYQSSRLNFRDPCTRYNEESGYQVCNGYIAIHNGGLWGVGLGNSTQKYLYLPEAHTDFIFAIIVEELGLIFGVFIVIGYFGILFLVLLIAKDTDNLRNSILCYGVFAYLFAHIAINMLGILGLIPLTGVPLPFLSYGGSYCVNVILALSIVQRVNIENAEAKDRKKIERL
jgi:cell division protein FtsW